MLFFEFGYVFDTLDNTKQRVTEGYLVKALKLGIQIQGVSLNADGGLQFYDFREVNLQRLEAFTDARFVSENECLSLIDGCLPVNFELSLYCEGLSSKMALKGDGIVILDKSLYIQPFYLNTISSDFVFDLRRLSDDSAFIVYSSLVTGDINCSNIAKNRDFYIPNVIIDNSKHDLFLFATLLLRGGIEEVMDEDALYKEEEVVPLFKYWYTYHYSDIISESALAKNQKQLRIYQDKKYSIAFLSTLERFFHTNTVESNFIQLCKSYLYVYGKGPSRFKTGINRILKVNKLLESEESDYAFGYVQELALD